MSLKVVGLLRFRFKKNSGGRLSRSNDCRPWLDEGEGERRATPEESSLQGDGGHLAMCWMNSLSFGLIGDVVASEVRWTTFVREFGRARWRLITDIR